MDNMSAMVIHDSSDLSESPASESDKSDEEKNQSKGVDLSKAALKVLNSNDEADVRLASIFTMLKGK